MQHVRLEAGRAANHLQGLALIQAALESEQLPVLVRQAQRLPGTQAVQSGAQAREAAQGGKVGEVELQASENAVQRVVVGDDYVDARQRQPQGGGCGQLGNGRPAGCGGGAGGAVPDPDGMLFESGVAPVAAGAAAPGPTARAPCRNDQPTIAQAATCNQKIGEGIGKDLK